MLEIIAISLILGSVSGLLAGLLGIGGGLIIVPVLVSLFSGHPLILPQQQMVMAIATSLATIIFTVLSSVMAHHRQQTILWYQVKRLIPGLLFGALFGTLIAEKINDDVLRFIFIGYLILMTFKMAFQINFNINIGKARQSNDYFAGSFIGLISALVGIGGGTLTVPYLLSRKIPMKNAVAISSACGFPIALSATVSYVVLGLQQPQLPPWSLGYIYLPAFIGIVACSIFTAPIGATLAHQLPAEKLKRYFALMLMIMAIKMIFR